MSSTITKTVGVAELSKYGFKNAAGAYVNWSKKISEASKGLVVPGGSYEMDIFVADSLKEYVNEVRATKTVASAPAPVAAVAAPKVAAPKPVAKAKDDSMSKDEWAAKDRRISRQGCIQIAVQVQSDFDEAVKLAEKMLEFVNG
jgi:hypothetical protein